MQYGANHIQNFAKYFCIQRIVIYVAIADTVPATNTSVDKNESGELIVKYTAEINIIGIAIKNEISIARFRSNPSPNRPAIVTPERDIPGKIVTDCKMPMIIACR